MAITRQTKAIDDHSGAAKPDNFHNHRVMNMKLFHLLPALSLLAGVAATAADNASYDNTMLNIPRVDSATQLGLFQDAVLQYTPQGTFKLLQAEELGKGRIYGIGSVLSVGVKQSGTLPVSVYLQVSGGLACGTVTGPARVHQRLQGTRFDISISAQHAAPLAPLAACTTEFRPYTVTVPLDVYGLAAGTYTYSVNGVATGSFTLAASNRFAEDCDVMANGRC